MTSLKQAARYDVLSNAWIPDSMDAPAHVRHAERVARGLRTPDSRMYNTSPVAATRLAWLYKSDNPKRHKFTNGEDTLYIAMPQNVEALAMFHFLSSCIVKVLRPKKNMPNPRVQFSLCGWPNKSTRMRLNRYAIELGVKLYVWQHENVQWCLWVHDGTVQFAPLGNDDKVIATNF